MRAYIAYKYTNHQDKAGLIKKLDILADKISLLSYDTFILGRDLKKWQHIKMSIFSLIPIITENMRKSQVFITFVNSEAFSKGLFIEVILSFLFIKKRHMVIEKPNKSKFLKYFFKNIHYVNSIEELELRNLFVL